MKLKLEKSLDHFQIEMTKRNQVPGLLEFIIEDEMIHYQTDTLTSLDEYLKAHTMTTKAFRKILGNFLAILEDSLLYYLDKKNYVIKATSIFVNYDLSEMKVAYLPILDDSEEVSDSEKCPARSFIYDVLLPRMKMNFEEDWTFFFKGVSQLNSFYHRPLPFHQVEELFLEQGVSTSEKNAHEMHVLVKEGGSLDDKRSFKHKFLGMIKRNKVALDSEENVNDMNKTTVLRAVSKSSYLKACDKKYTDVTLSTETLIIGRHKRTADVLINDGSIGKLHAELICEKDVYYLRDLNSVNGTFINEERLMPYEIKVIANGDIVKFSTIEYEVNYG